MDAEQPGPSELTTASPDQAAPLDADRRTASEVLREIAAMPVDKTETVTIGEIVAAFGERGFGLVVLLFALIGIMPGPPGFSSLVGLPFLLVAVQMMIGYRTPWLPRVILRREYRRSDLLRLTERAQPVLRRLEKLCRPRMQVMFRLLPPALLGALMSLLAFCVMIPLPLTNSIPSFAAVILSVAIIGADGLVLMVGIAAGFGAIALTVTIVAATAGVALMGLRALFGA
jgi:hypothetical protein